MTNHSITESGMEFYGEIFHIEKSLTYQKIQANVKISEFILLRDKPRLMIWLIEAKSSAPNPKNSGKFDEFIIEISEKLSNTFSLFIAILLRRHPTYHELPTRFQGLNLKTLEFRLLLIVRGHEDAWLPPLQEALEKALRTTVKIWNLAVAPNGGAENCVLVLNDELARQKGFIH